MNYFFLIFLLAVSFKTFAKTTLYPVYLHGNELVIPLPIDVSNIQNQFEDYIKKNNLNIDDTIPIKGKMSLDFMKSINLSIGDKFHWIIFGLDEVFENEINSSELAYIGLLNNLVYYKHIGIKLGVA